MNGEKRGRERGGREISRDVNSQHRLVQMCCFNCIKTRGCSVYRGGERGAATGVSRCELRPLVVEVGFKHIKMFSVRLFAIIIVYHDELHLRDSFF